MAKNNQEIRTAAKLARVPFWRIAEELKIQDSALSRKMRHELPQEEKEKILGIIAQLSHEGEVVI